MDKDTSGRDNRRISENAEKKYFVDARFGTAILQYGAIFTAVILVPLGILFSFINLVVPQRHMPVGLWGILLAVLCLVLFAVAVFFLTLRKYWVFTVEVSEKGLSVSGLLRTIDARWNDLLSISVLSTKILFGGKMIEVKTRAGSFFFPLTMKDKNQEYPKLDLLGEQWVQIDGRKKPISIENCSLYMVIKEHTSTV